VRRHEAALVPILAERTSQLLAVSGAGAYTFDARFCCNGPERVEPLKSPIKN
jgi:hypothetical protein